MDLETLREFVVFARHLNFSYAAKELNLTQSTLSKHIAALEKELGCDVVVRKRQLELTDAGRKLLQASQKNSGNLRQRN